MTVPDLAAWLLEQIAEDERNARDGTPLEAVTGHAWRVIETEEQGTGMGTVTTRMIVTGARPSLVARLGMDRERRVSTHIVAWDPRRVLAECDAKRRIIELEICTACDVENQPCDHRDATLRLLAEPYRIEGREGYRKEWRP